MTYPSNTSGKCARSKHRTAGFTLMETMVVLVLIGLLITITAPMYYNRVEQSRDLVLAQNLTALRTAIDQFNADTGRYPAQLIELVERQYLRTIPVDPITDSADTWVALTPEQAQRNSTEAARAFRERLQNSSRDDRFLNDDRSNLNAAQEPRLFDGLSGSRDSLASGIADVRSGAEGVTTKGVPYAEL